ncbi:MAG: hypothetical protein HY431_02875 [Candidatus Levybacteria bacterium]|nr:hypothetical protein [Candidatus Levybacteria bacterium]
MINTPRDLLLKILEVIDYSDDKEAFISEFIKNVRLQSLLDLISTLPTDKQEEIKTKLTTNVNDADKVASTLGAYFTPSQMQDALETASKDAITKYVETINRVLSVSQKQELANTFQELQTASA